MKKMLLILVLGSVILGACGPEPEPTVSVEEIQMSAVAAAFTMLAETQAAIPTATPIPPTATLPPSPTFTLMPIFTPTPLVPLATATTDKDECDKPLRSDPPGPHSPFVIRNKTKANANVSLWLDKTPFGECGYRGYSVRKNSEIKVEFPQGVIYGYAWILDPINTVVEGGPWKPNNPDKWVIEFDEHTMKMIGP